MTDKLRINRADIDAAKQTGYPPLFYAIRAQVWMNASPPCISDNYRQPHSTARSDFLP